MMSDGVCGVHWCFSIETRRKRKFGRSRRRCNNNNIKTDIKGIELDVMDQIYQAEDRDQ